MESILEKEVLEEISEGDDDKNSSKSDETRRKLCSGTAKGGISLQTRQKVWQDFPGEEEEMEEKEDPHTDRKRKAPPRHPQEENSYVRHTKRSRWDMKSLPKMGRTRSCLVSDPLSLENTTESRKRIHIYNYRSPQFSVELNQQCSSWDQSDDLPQSETGMGDLAGGGDGECVLQPVTAQAAAPSQTGASLTDCSTDGVSSPSQRKVEQRKTSSEEMGEWGELGTWPSYTRAAEYRSPTGSLLKQTERLNTHRTTPAAEQALDQSASAINIDEGDVDETKTTFTYPLMTHRPCDQSPRIYMDTSSDFYVGQTADESTPAGSGDKRNPDKTETLPVFLLISGSSPGPTDSDSETDSARVLSVAISDMSSSFYTRQTDESVPTETRNERNSDETTTPETSPLKAGSSVKMDSGSETDSARVLSVATSEMSISLYAGQTIDESASVEKRHKQNWDETKTAAIPPLKADFETTSSSILDVPDDDYAGETFDELSPADSEDQRSPDKTNTSPVSLSVAGSSGQADSDSEMDSVGVLYVDSSDMSSDSYLGQTLDELAPTENRHEENWDETKTTALYPLKGRSGETDSDSETDSVRILYLDTSDMSINSYLGQTLDESAPVKNGDGQNLDETRTATVSPLKAGSPVQTDSDSETNSSWTLYEVTSDDDDAEAALDELAPAESRDKLNRDERKTSPISISSRSGETDTSSETYIPRTVSRSVYSDIYSDSSVEGILKEPETAGSRDEGTLEETMPTPTPLTYSPSQTHSDYQTNSPRSFSKDLLQDCQSSSSANSELLDILLKGGNFHPRDDDMTSSSSGSTSDIASTYCLEASEGSPADDSSGESTSHHPHNQTSLVAFDPMSEIMQITRPALLLFQQEGGRDVQLNWAPQGQVTTESSTGRSLVRSGTGPSYTLTQDDLEVHPQTSPWTLSPLDLILLYDPESSPRAQSPVDMTQTYNPEFILETQSSLDLNQPSDAESSPRTQSPLGFILLTDSESSIETQSTLDLTQLSDPEYSPEAQSTLDLTQLSDSEYSPEAQNTLDLTQLSDSEYSPETQNTLYLTQLSDSEYSPEAPNTLDLTQNSDPPSSPRTQISSALTQLSDVQSNPDQTSLDLIQPSDPHSDLKTPRTLDLTQTPDLQCCPRTHIPQDLTQWSQPQSIAAQNLPVSISGGSIALTSGQFSTSGDEKPCGIEHEGKPGLSDRDDLYADSAPEVIDISDEEGDQPAPATSDTGMKLVDAVSLSGTASKCGDEDPTRTILSCCDISYQACCLERD